MAQEAGDYDLCIVGRRVESNPAAARSLSHLAGRGEDLRCEELRSAYGTGGRLRYFLPARRLSSIVYAIGGVTGDESLRNPRVPLRDRDHRGEPDMAHIIFAGRIGEATGLRSADVIWSRRQRR